MPLQPGEDPFTQLRKEKKERAQKQTKQQLANVKQAWKAGGAAAVPATLRLAAALPDKGRSKPVKRKELRDEVRGLGTGGERRVCVCGGGWGREVVGTACSRPWTQPLTNSSEGSWGTR